MCLRVDFRVECPECGYPLSEAQHALSRYHWVPHTPDYPVTHKKERIREQDKVVFNRGGILKEGFVVGIKRARKLSQFHDHMNWIITVRTDEGMSRVSNTKGIYILQRNEE